TAALGGVAATAGMAKRRNVCVLFWRRTGIVARSTVRALHHRRNWAHALSAKHIRYQDAGVAAWRPTARFAGDHPSHHALHEKAGSDGRRSDHDRLNYDNAQHLSENFLKKVRELYEGTRLGRQELQGAMILDPQNALFKDDWLIHDEVAEDLIEQVTVGVDPS